MLSNPRSNLLRTKNKVKNMCFGVLNIWHIVVFLKNVSPEMLPGKLVSAIFSEIQRINNRDQLAICALINGVPQEGCVPLVLNTAGSSLPLALWLSFYCWTRRWDQDVERLRAFFPPLFIKNRPGSLIWNFTSYSQMREAYFCSFIGDKEQLLLRAEYKSQPPIKFILQNRWEQLN